MADLIKIYVSEGFDGLVRSDHVPSMAGDDNGTPGYPTVGMVFGIGYIKGILDASGAPYQ